MHLERALAQVEDLKLQLDDALGEADMIEQLTERNLTLGDVSPLSCRFAGVIMADLSNPQKLEEMHANLEDLEQLTELNDELELNHLETEKQMQEEIGQFMMLPRIKRA